MRKTAIGPKDTVSICGRYLCHDADGSRFYMKGIAFPVAKNNGYNEKGWIAILEQLENLYLDYNTVRIYRMDPKIDYSAFFQAAAERGIYVIIPMTSAQGMGVLSREKSAPKCYTRNLFKYGTLCLENYMRYPNVLAGLLGNEVMNSPDTWHAAPCLKAYARDLKTYMSRTFDRSLPLIYAAQESSITPTADVVKSMRLTADYLTCGEQGDADTGTQAVLAATVKNPSSGAPLFVSSDSIDIFGVNMESWCGSNTTFGLNPDGTEGTYKRLYEGLLGTPTPLVFTELGCSHLQFNKDSPTLAAKGERDWSQVPVVLGPNMTETWSGFSAYAYYGNPQFNMFEGAGPWNGIDVLRPTNDFYNFQKSVQFASQFLNREAGFSDRARMVKPPPLSCSFVEDQFRSYYGIDLYDYRKIRSQVEEGGSGHDFLLVGVSLLVLVGLLGAIKWMKKKWSSEPHSSLEEVQSLTAGSADSNKKYHSVV